MSKLLILIGASMVLTAPAVAQDLQPAPIAIATTVQKNPDTDRLVCKRLEQIGSRLASKKVCMTAREWNSRAQADREDAEHLQQLTTTRQGG